MSITIIDIANQALDACRARASVSSVLPSDGSLAGNVITRHFWPRMDSLARAALWNSHRFQTQLTLLAARQGVDENPDGSFYGNPPWPWLYEYALPTGAQFTVTVAQDTTTSATQTVTVPNAPMFLRGRFIVPQVINSAAGAPIMTGGGFANSVPFPVGAVPPIPFIISSDVDANGNQMKVLLTNAQQAQFVYTSRIVDPTLWDPSFLEAAVATLASWIEQPINGNNQLGAFLVQQAQEAILRARVSDGDEGTSMIDNTPDWISARALPAAGMIGASSFYGPAWDSMAFPGGIVF